MIVGTIEKLNLLQICEKLVLLTSSTHSHHVSPLSMHVSLFALV
jgi:hypothetical protein